MLDGKEQFLKANAAAIRAFLDDLGRGNDVLSGEAEGSAADPHRHQDGARAAPSVPRHGGLLPRSGHARRGRDARADAGSTSSRPVSRRRRRTSSSSWTSATCRSSGTGKPRHAAAGGEGPRQDVHAADNRSVTAIDRLSLAIDEHEFVSIVGPSGCGKSTFLHILGGFEPATAATSAQRPAGRPSRPRSRHDVPGALAVSLAHRHRERRMAARDEGAAQARAPAQGRANISISFISRASPTSIRGSSAAA